MSTNNSTTAVKTKTNRKMENPTAATAVANTPSLFHQLLKDTKAVTDANNSTILETSTKMKFLTAYNSALGQLSEAQLGINTEYSRIVSGNFNINTINSLLATKRDLNQAMADIKATYAELFGVEMPTSI